MASDIQLLELARGIKDSLVRAGFLTIESILCSTIADLSSKVGVDPYIAQIILEAARKFGTVAPVANL
jgi:small basic protein